MRKFLIIFMMTGIILSSENIMAQVWPGALPMFYNPSFAGSEGEGRAAVWGGYRRDNRNSISEFNRQSSIGGSYDFFLEKLSTGVGLTIYQQGYKNINNPYLFKGNYISSELSIAPKISFSGKYSLSPSIGVSHQFSKADNNYHFNPDFMKIRISTFKLRSGILFNSKKFYAGLTMDVYSPQPTYRGLPVKRTFKNLSLQLGYTNDDGSKTFAFSPNLVYQFNLFHEISFRFASHLIPDILTLKLRYKKFIFGPGYYNYSGFNFMLGYQSDRLKIMAMPGGFSQYKFSGNLGITYSFGK